MYFVPHALWTRERQLPTQGAKSVGSCSSLSEILVKLVFSLRYLFFSQIPCSFDVASHVDLTDKHWKQQLWVDNNRFVMHVMTSRETTLSGGARPSGRVAGFAYESSGFKSPLTTYGVFLQ